MAETILIVEDNPETLELLRRIMERDGYETILANDGEKGLNYASRYMPDLIILDRLMPKLNGLQVCRKLKEKENTRHIPIVFLTILDSEQDVIDGLKAGADDYITKPFSPDELSVRIERVLFRYVRSTIEDLLAKTTTPGTRVGCIEPLIEKLSRTEKSLRDKLRQNMTVFAELGRSWTALFRGLQAPGNQNTMEGLALISRESQTVNWYTAYFTKTLNDYGLLRWLIALIYRLDREISQEFIEESETVQTLKRMYAESTLIIHRIESALHILEKTNRFLQQRQEILHADKPE
jgi:DNA-binding response OmpR family regulator